jgi:TPR repeat protein
MHAKGLGVRVDVQEAIRHYEAVGRVEILAAIELGRIYSQGLGVTPDPETAANWYRVAATLGDAGSDEMREALHYLDKAK